MTCSMERSRRFQSLYMPTMQAVGSGAEITGERKDGAVHKWNGPRWLSVLTAIALTFASITASASPNYRAELRRSSYGIPHIKAANEAGLGYGLGYAYAEDNFCLLADTLVTVNGQRSRYFGPEGTTADIPMFRLSNETADYFYTLLNPRAAVEATWQHQIPEVQRLLEGYAAGYNRYLGDRGKGGLPTACANADWVRPITALDLLRLMRRYAVLNSSGNPLFVGGLLAAAPPGPAAHSGPAAPSKPSPPLAPADNGPPAAREQGGALPLSAAELFESLRPRTASNAVALGRDATASGHGMLLGNPHFPWEGDLRLYQLHLTIPGRLDVMGATLPGLPIVGIGFTHNFAWSHTTTTAAHFTLYALQLSPQDPTKYVVDGKLKSMRSRSISIVVKEADGSLRHRSHTFYESEFGPLLVLPQAGLTWSSSTAFAMHDAAREDWRVIEQFYAMDRATTLDELASSVERLVGNPWNNTIAADEAGHVIFQAITPVPNLSAHRLQSCVPEAYRPLAGAGVFVLTGNTAACQWENDPAAPQPGILPGKRLPVLRRTDFVQNSNDSAWMTNPAAPLTGYSPLASSEGHELGGRTRMGLTQILARLAGRDGLSGNRFTLQQLEQIALNDHVYSADVLMDDLLELCKKAGTTPAGAGANVDFTQPCKDLAAWDRTANLNAGIGYGYFSGWVQRLRGMSGFWRFNFDPADPVNTPRGLNLSDPKISQSLLGALAEAVRAAPNEGWSAQSKWGDLQLVVRGGLRIPIHGGADDQGVYNMAQGELRADHTRTVSLGSSYIQAVTFENDGPRVDAFLTYSQSTDPRSPHFADQTERFSRKDWIRLPFTQAQIEADPGYSLRVLSE